MCVPLSRQMMNNNEKRYVEVLEQLAMVLLLLNVGQAMVIALLLARMVGV